MWSKTEIAHMSCMTSRKVTMSVTHVYGASHDAAGASKLQNVKTKKRKEIKHEKKTVRKVTKKKTQKKRKKKNNEKETKQKKKKSVKKRNETK